MQICTIVQVCCCSSSSQFNCNTAHYNIKTKTLLLLLLFICIFCLAWSFWSWFSLCKIMCIKINGHIYCFSLFLCFVLTEALSIHAHTYNKKCLVLISFYCSRDFGAHHSGLMSVWSALVRQTDFSKWNFIVCCKFFTVTVLPPPESVKRQELLKQQWIPIEELYIMWVYMWKN